MKEKIEIPKEVKRLMKMMSFIWARAEKSKKYFKQFFECYQILGRLAWTYLCEHCKHKYVYKKKHKAFVCSICGKIRITKNGRSRR